MSLKKSDLQRAVLETTWGPVSIQASRRNVLSCSLPPAPSNPVSFRWLHMRLPRTPFPVLKKAAAYGQALLEGRKPGQCPALDFSRNASVTDFRRAVWKAMRRIPRGETATYAEVAKQAGSPGASRAVGGACGANPLPLFIPCHRVVAAGGRLGGFSSGTAWKTLLLTGEGVDL